MKYLVQWIKKELNPEKQVSSITTNSEYFYIHNAKIRISDHLGRDDNDLQIIVVKDLLGQNKQFLLKEAEFPTLVSIPDVKTLKIALTTFLFHYKNVHDTEIVKKNVTERDAQELIKQREQDTLSAISKLNECLDITPQEAGAFGEYMTATLPQWKEFTTTFRKFTRNLFRSGLSLQEFIDVINKEFDMSDNTWRTECYSGWQKRLKPYVDEKYYDETVEIVPAEDIENSVNLCGHDNAFLKMAHEFIQMMSLPVEKREEKKSQIIGYIGNMLRVDTDGMYSKLTEGQKKIYRELILTYNIPYNTVVEFFKRTMSKSKKAIKPSTDPLKVVVSRFLNLYKHGIIKYPDDDDFDTYQIPVKVSDCNTICEQTDADIQEETIVEVQEEPITEETVIEEPVIETIVTEEPVVEEQSQPEVVEHDGEYYPEFENIPDITELFTDSQINIIKTVIKTIDDAGGKSTSFEKKRILDVFKCHYSDIWSRLTWSQREICSGIITNERMTLNETDFIINKVFNKSSFNWPQTVACRKIISEYCRQVRVMREAA